MFVKYSDRVKSGKCGKHSDSQERNGTAWLLRQRILDHFIEMKYLREDDMDLYLLFAKKRDDDNKFLMWG